MTISNARRNEYSKAINVRIPKWYSDRFEAFCKARNVTKSQAIYHLIKELVNNPVKPPILGVKPDLRRKDAVK